MAGPWAAYALVTDISIMAGVDREEFWSAEGYARRHMAAIRGSGRVLLLPYRLERIGETATPLSERHTHQPIDQ